MFHQFWTRNTTRVRTDGEIARITSLYKHNGELVAEGKLYDDSSDICTDEIMIYPNWMEPIPVTMLLLEKNGWWRDKSNANTFNVIKEARPANASRALILF